MYSTVYSTDDYILCVWRICVYLVNKTTRQHHIPAVTSVPNIGCDKYIIESWPEAKFTWQQN